MRPWKVSQDPRSDFTLGDARSQQRLLSTAPPNGAAGYVAGSVAATLALGFTEACLHLEHRPVPLRFAAKYALYNLVPSAVWATVSPHHVAVASNLPLSRLVVAPAMHAELNLSSRANRIIAIKSIRALRYVAGSYGLVWSLWRWHEIQQQQQQQLDQPHEGAAQLASRVGRVVRLTLSDSPLAKATKAKHGDNVLQIPWQDLHPTNPMGWNAATLGAQASKSISSDSADGITVLEVEIDPAHDSAASFLVAKRTAAGVGGFVRTAAVVDATATPDWQARNGVDVYFFALSGIVQFLSDHYEQLDMQELILISTTNDDDDSDGSSDSHESEQTPLLQMVRRALIHHRGIPTTVNTVPFLDGNEDEEDDGNARVAQENALAVVFASTGDAAAKQVQEIVNTGFVPIDRILVVVEESLTGWTPDARSRLGGAAGVLSVADLSDSILQHIRMQLRAGASCETIQSTIFEEFGEQSALAHRANEASKISKFI